MQGEEDNYAVRVGFGRGRVARPCICSCTTFNYHIVIPLVFLTILNGCFFLLMYRWKQIVMYHWPFLTEVLDIFMRNMVSLVVLSAFGCTLLNMPIFNNNMPNSWNLLDLISLVHVIGSLGSSVYYNRCLAHKWVVKDGTMVIITF